MTPQLNPAQLQHALDNGAKLVEAKKLEIEGYHLLQANATPALQSVLDTPWTMDLCRGIEQVLQSTITRAEVELEELEMQVKAYQFMQKQANSRIQLPNLRG